LEVPEKQAEIKMKNNEKSNCCVLTRKIERMYLRARRKSNHDKSKLLCFDEKNRVSLRAHQKSNQ
jgi:hypothetical protein